MNPLARRGFSLIEAVVVIVVLGIIVPPSIMMLQDSANERIDAVNIARASLLAESIVESIVADAAGCGEGTDFSAMADVTAYLDDPDTGLRVRLERVTESYSGFDFDIETGDLVDSEGGVNTDEALNVFRHMTVVVHFPRATRVRGDLRVTTIVSAMQ